MFSSLLTCAVVFTIAFISIKKSKTDLTYFRPSQQQRKRKLFGADRYRWATFGGANTYGLGSHLKRRFDAFPFLLSESVHNYGSVTLGSNFNAVCLHSLITDEYMYDIFLVDFSHSVDDNLLHLAKRIRARFPNALIIFIEYWRPLNIHRVDPITKKGTKLLSWMKEKGLTNWTSDEFKKEILADTGTWKDDRDYQGGSLSKVEEFATFVNGHIVSMIDIKDNVAHGLVEHGHLFSKPTLLSEEGHRLMADKVKAFVDGQLISMSNFRLGTWHGGDSCHMWFADGGCQVTYGERASLVEYDVHRGKFALEFPTKEIFNITNTFPEYRQLYLSYIASSTDGIYPNVLIEFGDSHHTVLPGKHNRQSSLSEYPITIPVGFISPGTHSVTVTPETVGFTLPGTHFVQVTPENYIPNIKPFRMVGLTFSNEITVPDQYAFAPLFTE